MDSLKEDEELAAAKDQTKSTVKRKTDSEVIDTPTTPVSTQTTSFSTPTKSPGRQQQGFQSPFPSTPTGAGTSSATKTPLAVGETSVDNHAELASFFNSLISKEKS